MRTEFIADSAKVKWDEVEIEPVRENASGDCEPVEEGQETFWSVYLHQIEGGVVCIADLPTKDLAIGLKELIENAARSFAKEQIKWNDGK